MEILILSSLARRPMHGYEIKLELRYKHVQWWAKCDHGHLYATLPRLERRGLIAQQRDNGASGRQKKVFSLTDSGREYLNAGLVQIGLGEDGTFFDIDLFISSSIYLDQQLVLDTLRKRRDVLEEQRARAAALKARVDGFIPPNAHLIIAHRIDHLDREIAYVDKALEMFQAQTEWHPMVGDEPIANFISRTQVPLED